MDDDVDWNQPQVVGGLPTSYSFPAVASSSSSLASPYARQGSSASTQQAPPATYPPPLRDELVDRTDFVDLLGWKKNKTADRWRAWSGNGKAAEKHTAESDEDSDVPLAAQGGPLPTTNNSSDPPATSTEDDDDNTPLHLTSSRDAHLTRETSPQPIDSEEDEEAMLEDRTNVLFQRGYRADSPRYGRPKAFRSSASSSPNKPLSGGSRPVPASVLAARAAAAASSRKRSPSSQPSNSASPPLPGSTALLDDSRVAAKGSSSPQTVASAPQPAKQRDGLTPETALELSPASVTMPLSPEETAMEISPAPSPEADAQEHPAPPPPGPPPGPPPRPSSGLGLTITPHESSTSPAGHLAAPSAPPTAPAGAVEANQRPTPPTSAMGPQTVAHPPPAPPSAPAASSQPARGPSPPQADAEARRVSPPLHQRPARAEPRRSASDQGANRSNPSAPAGGANKRRRESSDSVEVNAIKRKRPSFQPLASIMARSTSAAGKVAPTVKPKKRVSWKDNDHLVSTRLFTREPEYDGPDAVHRSTDVQSTAHHEEGEVFRQMSHDSEDVLQAIVQATACIDWYPPLPIYVAPEDDVPSVFKLGMDSQEAALPDKVQLNTSLSEDSNLRKEPVEIALPSSYAAEPEPEPAPPPVQQPSPHVDRGGWASPVRPMQPPQHPIHQPPPPLANLHQTEQYQPPYQQHPQPLPAPQPLGLTIPRAPAQPQSPTTPIVPSPSERYGREHDNGWSSVRNSMPRRESAGNGPGQGWRRGAGQQEREAAPSNGWGRFNPQAPAPPTGPSAASRSNGWAPAGPSNADSSRNGGSTMTPQEWEVKKQQNHGTKCRFFWKGQICQHGERCWYKH